MTGDYNLPNAFTFSPDKSKGKEYAMFYDFIAKIQPVTQCVNFPTRDLNILDLIFIRDTSKLSNKTCHPAIGRSNHNLIFGNYNIINLISNTFSKKFLKIFTKIDNEGFKKYVVSTLETIDYTHLSIIQMWDLFLFILNNGINLYLPNYTTYLHKNKTFSSKNNNLYHKIKRQYHELM